MLSVVCFVWLSIIVTSVAANPLSQLAPAEQCAICQPNQFNNLNSVPSTFQPAASQASPYVPPVAVPNQTPKEAGLKINLNEVLINKIFGSPCLQKILDPNTKLYNQNGQEIQRQPNTGSAPSVINNYFIVPPEFFNLNYTKPANKSKNVAKKRKNSTSRKAKTNKIIENQEDPIILQDVEPNKRQKNSGCIKNKEKKKSQNQTSDTVLEEIEKVEKEDKNVKPEATKKIKRRRKKGSSNKKENPIILTPSSSDNFEEDNLQREADVSPVIENIKKKKLKQTRRKQSNEVIETLSITDSTEEQSNTLSKKKEVTSPPIIEKPPSHARKRKKMKSTIETENVACLKNIESPVDNCETKDFEENRRARNSKTDNVRSESTQKFTPNPEEILRNFYPFMGNNFYPNGNYPFNFEQFYQPYFGRKNKNNKKRKTKHSQNDKNNKESLPNVVKLKLKPKKKEITTTESPIVIESIEEIQLKTNSEEMTIQSSEEITNTSIYIGREVTPIEENNKESLPNDVTLKLKPKMKEITTTENPIVIESIEELQLKLKSEEKTTQSSEEITNTSIYIAHEVTPIDVRKEDVKIDPESERPKTELKLTKLEMPPTVIEDLHAFITPELGREDVVPTLHTNGIINDYYPIFFDDAYYGHDESYYIKDLEDDRHFYTTDRGHEDLLNRERRKYDSNVDYRLPNLDNKDHTNTRRGFKYRMKNFNDDEENTLQRPYTHDRITQRMNIPTKTNKHEEVEFRTPPLLENPDFRTRKVEKPSADMYSDEHDEEICQEYSSRRNSDKCKTYSDIEFPQFQKMALDTDKISSTNGKPNNDRIETVFAKTRVVKYGVTKDDSEDNPSISNAHEDKDDMKYYSDGQTTYIVAKSLGQFDDYYW